MASPKRDRSVSAKPTASGSISIWYAPQLSGKPPPSLSPRLLRRPTIISTLTLVSCSPCTSSFGPSHGSSPHQPHTPFMYPSPASNSPASLLWKRERKVAAAPPTRCSPLETRQTISSQSVIPAVSPIFSLDCEISNVRDLIYLANVSYLLQL